MLRPRLQFLLLDSCTSSWDCYLIEHSHRIHSRRRMLGERIYRSQVIQGDSFADADQRFVQRNIQPTWNGRRKPLMKVDEFQRISLGGRQSRRQSNDSIVQYGHQWRHQWRNLLVKLLEAQVELEECCPHGQLWFLLRVLLFRNSWTWRFAGSFQRDGYGLLFRQTARS